MRLRINTNGYRVKELKHSQLSNNILGCSCMKKPVNLPRNWSLLSYPGEVRVPGGIDSNAGWWYLYFIKRYNNEGFTTVEGKPISFNILHPSSINFDDELLIVKEILENLTKEKKLIAEYWGDGPATKQWTPIIDRLIDTYGLGPVYAARVLAAVQAGINDAFIITWYYKYLWDVPRPCQLDQSMLTEICTPKFPAYPSGHAVISGTAEVILSYFFPAESDELKQLAEENGNSRLYGGVHYPSDISEGLRLGRQIGEIIVDILKNQSDINQVRIDSIKNTDLQADIQPYPYKQAIPYPSRARSCDLPLLPKY